MTQSISPKPLPDSFKSDRAWRLDAAVVHSSAGTKSELNDRPPGFERKPIGPDTRERTRSDAFAGIASWHFAVRTWLSERIKACHRVNARFEDLLHQFAATVATAQDPNIVEAALLRLAHQLAPASRIELLADPMAAFDDDVDAEASGEDRAGRQWAQAGGQAVLELPLRCGASVFGRLRVRSRSGGLSPLRTQTVQRLKTLCTMAAASLECLDSHSGGRRDDDFTFEHEVQSDRPSRQTCPAAPPVHPSVLLHDATFLNAVLPYALNQARRHREPLSLLCVAVDRQRSVEDLLGRAEVDRLIRHVGEITRSSIRVSDIVARLDDDRVIAVLPRAPRGGAIHVAEKICRAIAGSKPSDSVTPNLTVSIGVATFPSCAGNVYSLFDAADEALARAQHQGRNQAVLAPPRPCPATAEPLAEALAHSS